jgi:hypothetical protein
MTMRRWRAYAGQAVGRDGAAEFRNVGLPHYVRMYGREPVPVELTEDPDGRYWGFVYADAPERGPVMVQPSQSLFRVQFPYGPEQAVNKGEVVRLSIRAIDEDELRA